MRGVSSVVNAVLSPVRAPQCWGHVLAMQVDGMLIGEQIHMAANDYAGGIEACMRLGDASRGGNPQLWTDMLDYLTQQEEDVTAEVLPEHNLFVVHSLSATVQQCAGNRAVKSSCVCCCLWHGAARGVGRQGRRPTCISIEKWWLAPAESNPFNMSTRCRSRRCWGTLRPGACCHPWWSYRRWPGTRGSS